MDIEKEIFEGKKVADLVKEAYESQKLQDELLKAEIAKLAGFIVGAGDAIAIIPILNDLISANVKNNEVLIKIISLFKETGNKAENSDNAMLSEKEIQQLFNEVHSMNSTAPSKMISD